MQNKSPRVLDREGFYVISYMSHELSRCNLKIVSLSFQQSNFCRLFMASLWHIYFAVVSECLARAVQQINRRHLRFRNEDGICRRLI